MTLFMIVSSSFSSYTFDLNQANVVVNNSLTPFSREANCRNRALFIAHLAEDIFLAWKRSSVSSWGELLKGLQGREGGKQVKVCEGWIKTCIGRGYANSIIYEHYEIKDISYKVRTLSMCAIRKWEWKWFIGFLRPLTDEWKGELETNRENGEISLI